MVIGLTGGIGVGKSTAARILAELGAFVIDADRIGHAVYEPNTSGWKKLVAEFGNGIVGPDGAIDRRKLGALVFADARQLARLNALVHPLIADEIQRQVRERLAVSPEGPVVIEAAIMIEAGWHLFVDELWVVVAGQDAVLQRLGSQRNLDAASIAARMRVQLSDEERRRYATVVIDNSGTVEDLRHALHQVWQTRVARRQESCRSET